MSSTDSAVQEQHATTKRQRVVNDFSIQVATVNGSGSQTANLVLLRSNPLSDIRHTKEIESVIQGGRYYSRNQLDAMLNRAEEKAAAAAARQTK